MSFEQTPFKRLLTRNDGGVWGDDPDGIADTIVLRSTEQTVDGHWTIDDPAPRKLDQADAVRFRLHCGDLLVTKSSGSPSHIGKATLVTHEVASMRPCYSNFMQRLRVSATDNARFYWYVLRTKETREQMGFYSTTSTGLANLNATVLGELIVPRPPIQTQLRIVDFLDHELARIDDLIGKQERLIGLLAERRQAIVTTYVANEVQPRTEDFGLRLKHIYSIVDERAKGADLPLMSVSIHRGIQRREETTDDEPRADDLSNYKVCRAGDIVLNRMRAFQGALGSSSETGLVSPDYLVVRPHQWIEPRWLEMVLRSNWAIGEMQSRLRGIGSAEQGVIRTPRINASDLGEIRIRVPSINSQRSSVAGLRVAVERLEHLSEKSVAVVKLLHERSSRLISAAVTGHLDSRR